ncbi:hypothetical protein [Bombella apis]|uniref:hypothetical protein n=1 Tax=Bombella apis TaxID=1785988 RepID=UPI0024A972D2|nr:hypothetical protein [Bombella apis]
MSFNATVYKILIASPGDVEEEREAIPDIIMKWNNTNSETNNIVLLPVRWESHSAPLMGGRPQDVLNKQLVDSCDMVIGVFWTRLGSPTGFSESGTAEEIESFIESNKPAMLYFSSCKIDPSKIDPDQYRALKDFEGRMKKIGLVGGYKNITDFNEQLLRQITIHVNNMKSGIPSTPLSPHERKEQIASIKSIAKSSTIYMEDYRKNGNVKSFLVKGNTTSIKDDLKRLGGKWNSTLKSWVFPISKRMTITEYLKKIN